jgi:hypothetical protein
VPQKAREEEGRRGREGGRVGKVTNCVGSGTERNTTIILALLKKMTRSWLPFP